MRPALLALLAQVAAASQLGRFRSKLDLRSFGREAVAGNEVDEASRKPKLNWKKQASLYEENPRMDANESDALNLSVVHDIPQLSEELISIDRDQCTGCDFTIDLRCDNTRIHRWAAFHRIHDCVVPMYGMVQLAHAASENKSAQVCALTWKDDKTGMDIQDLLRDVAGFRWHKLVAEDDGCVGGLKYRAAWRSWYLGATHDYLDNFGKDPNMLNAYSINIQNNLGWLHRDVNAFVGNMPPTVIMINRFNESRSFKPESFAMLRESMSHHVKMGQTMYRGSESLIDTVRKFSNAAVVIGYHGAAWANTLFTARKHCSHQVTTWEDYEEKKMWRVNWQIEENKLGKLSVYTVPLRNMLKINAVDETVYNNLSDKDHFIKDLPWVPLDQTDVSNLMRDVKQCVKEWAQK